MQIILSTKLIDFLNNNTKYLAPVIDTKGEHSILLQKYYVYNNNLTKKAFSFQRNVNPPSDICFEEIHLATDKIVPVGFSCMLYLTRLYSCLVKFFFRKFPAFLLLLK